VTYHFCSVLSDFNKHVKKIALTDFYNHIVIDPDVGQFAHNISYNDCAKLCTVQ